ncbi:hypothetical protein D3C75_1121140 [compost metagenome]
MEYGPLSVLFRRCGAVWFVAFRECGYCNPVLVDSRIIKQNYEGSVAAHIRGSDKRSRLLFYCDWQ